MMRKITMIATATRWVSLARVIIAFVLFTLIYALFNCRVQAEEVTEIVNQRLAAEVDDLSKELAQAKSDKLNLQGALNNLNRDRSQLLERLKIITEENSKLKEQITTLQEGLINLDNVRKQVIEDNSRKIEEILRDRGQLADRLAALEKQLQSERNFKKEVSEKRQRDEVKKLEEQNQELKKELVQSEIILNKLKEERLAFKVRLEKFAEANKELKRLKRETADMHYNLGVIFQEENKWEEAIREYEKALETKPDDVDTHYNLALIYDSVKNNRGKAVYHYQKYLGIQPDAADAQKVKERIIELNSENKVWGEARRIAR